MLFRPAPFLLVAALLPGAARADESSSLVLSSKGTPPLVLTVPHDGGEFLGLQGEHSLIGLLATKGYRVNPAVGAESLREDPRFTGGYTVFTFLAASTLKASTRSSSSSARTSARTRASPMTWPMPWRSS
jgi:hypothetical protein